MKAKLVPLEPVVGPSEYFRPCRARCFSNSARLSTSNARCVRSGWHFTGSLPGKKTDFNFSVAFRCLKKNEFRAARRFMAANFLEAESVAVKFHGAFEIVHAIASVQKFADFHAQKIAVLGSMAKMQSRGA